MPYINNLLPRLEDICIQNKYELINISNDDFHYVIYFLEKNKIKLIIRRLDSDGGWGINLSLKIFSYNNNDSEIISIGSSELNFKKINIYTNINILPIEYNLQKIPKLIFQTTFNKNIENIYHYNSILTYIELNPEYEYILLNDNECREFIKKNFDESTLYSYDLIIAGAFKADFFRYCYLYINGGCYFDCKSILRKPLRDVINRDDTLLLCKDIGIGYYNAMMMSEKNNDKIMHVINSCKNNINDFYKIYNFNNKLFNHADNILSLTGPVLLYYSINELINKNDVLKFHHRDNHNHYHNYKKLCIEYNGEYFSTKQFMTYNPNGNHYSDLWFRREIIYKLCNTKYFNNYYKYYVFIGNTKDDFNFHIFDEKTLIVERIDSNNGWGNNLKLKIINEEENTENKIDIGNSQYRYKLYFFDNDFFNCKISNIKIKSYKNISDIYPDEFKISICRVRKYRYKLIIYRIDSNEGWGQDLTINIILDNNTEHNINVGNSLNNIKIIDFNIK
jgi:mannosyltransferase OCH1-like enzyme